MSSSAKATGIAQVASLVSALTASALGPGIPRGVQRGTRRTDTPEWSRAKNQDFVIVAGQDQALGDPIDEPIYVLAQDQSEDVASLVETASSPAFLSAPDTEYQRHLRSLVRVPTETRFRSDLLSWIRDDARFRESADTAQPALPGCRWFAGDLGNDPQQNGAAGYLLSPAGGRGGRAVRRPDWHRPGRLQGSRR